MLLLNSRDLVNNRINLSAQIRGNKKLRYHNFSEHGVTPWVYPGVNEIILRRIPDQALATAFLPTTFDVSDAANALVIETAVNGALTLLGDSVVNVIKIVGGFAMVLSDTYTIFWDESSSQRVFGNTFNTVNDVNHIILDHNVNDPDELFVGFGDSTSSSNSTTAEVHDLILPITQATIPQTIDFSFITSVLEPKFYRPNITDIAVPLTKQWLLAFT